MKRIFCLIGFSYFITLTLLFFIPEAFLIYVSGMFFILFLIFIALNKFRNEKALPLCMLTCIAATAVYTFNYNFNIKPLEIFDNQDVVISGKAIDLPYKQYGTYYYTLKINKMNDKEVKSFKIRLSSSEPLEVDLYDEFNGKIHFYLPQNMPDFNYKAYYRSKGIYILAYAYNYTPYKVTACEDFDIYYYILKLKYKMLSIPRYLFTSSIADTMNGMLLGEKHYIPEEVKEAFDSVGIYHLVATSGIHVAIISQFILWILKALKINRKLSSIIASAGVILFVGLTGFSVSGMRAGIVTVLYLIGSGIFRSSDPLNSLGIAVLIISLFNPDSSIDIGLWLSVTAALGIILLKNKINSWINKKLNIKNNQYKFLNYIIAIFSVSLAVSIFTFILIGWFYKKTSLLFALSNVLIIPLVTLLLNCLLILDILWFLKAPQFLLMPTALVCGITTNLITSTAHLLSKLPFTFYSLDYKFISLCSSFSLVLVGITLIFKNWKKLLRTSSILSALIFLSGILSYTVFINGFTRVTIVNSLDGIGIIISKNLHKAVIIYANEGFCESRLNTYLSTSPFYFLDYLNINSSTPISASYVNEFTEKYHPKITVLPENLSELKIDSSFTNPIYFKGKLSSELYENVLIENFEIENNNFIKLKVNNVSFFICCDGGDISKLPYEKYKACDILVASKLPLNYKYIDANNTVLSMSKENSEIVINKLNVNDKKVFSTSQLGNVYVDIDKSSNYIIRRSR